MEAAMPDVPVRTGHKSNTATARIEAQEGAEAIDVMVSMLGDTALVVATQVGAMGTLVQAQMDSAAGSFRTSVLMGKRDDPLLGGRATSLPPAVSRGGRSSKQGPVGTPPLAPPTPPHATPSFAPLSRRGGREANRGGRGAEGLGG